MTFFDENRSRRCGGNPVFDYVNVITETTTTTQQVHAGWVLPRHPSNLVFSECDE
jgi:hypothetical protein